MGTKRNIWLVMVALMALAAGAFAQQTQPQRHRQMGQMSMDDMMKQCREHCQATSQSVDQTLATIREARQSNDPAKMRAALETVEKPLAEMQEHMNLKHVKDGVYRGAGNVMMAGRWDVTVVVTRAGKELGSRKLTVTAK